MLAVSVFCTGVSCAHASYVALGEGPSTVGVHWNFGGKLDHQLPRNFVFLYPAMVALVNVGFESHHAKYQNTASKKTILYYRFLQLESNVLLLIIQMYATRNADLPRWTIPLFVTGHLALTTALFFRR